MKLIYRFVRTEKNKCTTHKKALKKSPEKLVKSKLTNGNREDVHLTNSHLFYFISFFYFRVITKLWDDSILSNMFPMPARLLGMVNGSKNKGILNIFAFLHFLRFSYKVFAFS